jgi:hypothetical protein
MSARCTTLRRPVISRVSCVILARTYASRGSASNFLPQSLDIKPQATRRQETVGPFGLGVSPSAQSPKNVKRWSELGTGGKGNLPLVVNFSHEMFAKRFVFRVFLPKSYGPLCGPVICW